MDYNGHGISTDYGVCSAPHKHNQIPAGIVNRHDACVSTRAILHRIVIDDKHFFFPSLVIPVCSLMNTVLCSVEGIEF
jgi:hypothetical protein